MAGSRPDPALLVVAIGGNALRTERGTDAPEEWFAVLERSLPPLGELVALGYRLLLTHGNGPQVGDELRRMELARKQVPPLTLDLCGAATQGSLGYAIQQIFGNLLRSRGIDRPVAGVVTQVVVDRTDPAFHQPTKPIGPFLSRVKARRLAREHGWQVVDDAGRGYRRVVPSPNPVRVVEAPAIRRLVEAGVIPIAAGGGGIPVVEGSDGLCGVEAVIEKDLTTSLLARELGAEQLLLLTGVERVALGFGTPFQRPLDRMSAAQARSYLAAGEFPSGSMGPKVEAATGFVEGGGRVAIITALEKVRDAVEGRAGTRVEPA